MCSWSGQPICPTSSKTLVLPNLPRESGNPTFFRSASVKPARCRSNFLLFSKKPSPSRISTRKAWPQHGFFLRPQCMVHTCTHTHVIIVWMIHYITADFVIMATTQPIIVETHRAKSNVSLPWHVGYEVEKFPVGSPCCKQLWNGNHAVGLREHLKIRNV